jgi:hypothetical protein
MPKPIPRNPFLALFRGIPRLFKGYFPIFLDYPPNPVPRWGYGKAAHPQIEHILAQQRDHYRQLLTGFLDYTAYLLAIPLRQPKSSEQPSWIHNWLEGLDTLALYGFVASRKPARYLEIGSGYSTKLVRRAIRDHSLPTQLISVDPHPRAEVDGLCDQIIRQPLETTDLSGFDQLEAGDFLFFDGSHRAFMNSDVTVFFLEVLPRLKPGVLVHIHDIELPYDYMPERAHWYYSEQYLLGASLLAGHRNFRVVLPNAYVGREADLVFTLKSLGQQLPGVAFRGTSFWIETQ